MKNNNLKFWSVAYLLFFVLFTGTLFAQSAINITGTFEGLRSQYDKNQKNFTKEFQYKYELTQEGDVVRGTSTIISEEGDYAEVSIRGIVKDNKFYFEEYSVKDQIRPENLVWCYKVGVLDIELKDNEIILSGKTPSYMINYGLACSGGFTKLTAISKDVNTEQSSRNTVFSENFDLNLFPNPTTEKINFSFNNADSKFVSFEVFDLTGKKVFKSTKRQINKGNFSEYIKVNEMGLSNGMYIFNLNLDDKSYSKEFVVKN